MTLAILRAGQELTRSSELTYNTAYQALTIPDTRTYNQQNRMKWEPGK